MLWLITSLLYVHVFVQLWAKSSLLHSPWPDSGVFCVSASPWCLCSSWINPRCIPGSPYSLHAAFVSELWNFLGLHFACIIECLPQLNSSLCSFTQQGLSCSYKFKFNIKVGGERLWQRDTSPQFYEHHWVVTVRYDIHIRPLLLSPRISLSLAVETISRGFLVGV